ncbi:RraA family protein [Devosia sp.]|uniref:RraA family protein n=1 Tax=Devosia sp. TaxID=1871048 RepID=UPI002F1CD606
MNDMNDETSMTARLEACYTGVVHDVLRAMGCRDFALPPELRPLMPEKRLAGPAFTIVGKSAPSADPHETLLAWTGLLSKAPAGHVWVSQPNDRIVAQMGELSAETLKDKGVRGCVADGYIRDTDFLIDIGFQAWSRGHTPRDIVGQWLPTAYDVEIRIGDVVINPGDFLLGDRDGLVRIPRDLLEVVVERSEVAMSTESEVRKSIRAGMDPQEAYLKYGKF